MPIPFIYFFLNIYQFTRYSICYNNRTLPLELIYVINKIKWKGICISLNLACHALSFVIYIRFIISLHLLSISYIVREIITKNNINKMLPVPDNHLTRLKYNPVQIFRFCNTKKDRNTIIPFCISALIYFNSYTIEINLKSSHYKCKSNYSCIAFNIC